MLRQVASSSSSSLRSQVATYCSSSSSTSSLNHILSSTLTINTSSRRPSVAIFAPAAQLKRHNRFYATPHNAQGSQDKAAETGYDSPPSSIKISHTTSPSKHQQGGYATRETFYRPTRASTAQSTSASNTLESSIPPSQSSVSSPYTSTENSSGSQQTKTVTRSDHLPHSTASNLPAQQAGPSEPAEKKTIGTRIKGIYTQLKYLFQFYLNGVKQIWRDRQRVLAIRAAIRLEGDRQQSWAEARLVRTHAKDLRKLPLFLAILLILEEILPLVVIYAPFLLPSTCILPSQIAKIRQSEEVKRAKAVDKLRKSKEVQQLMDVAGLPLKGSLQDLKERISTDVAGGQSRQKEALRRWSELSRDSLSALSHVFGLPTLARPAVMLRLSLESHLLRIVQDDVLLANATAMRSSVPSPYDADSQSFTPAAELPVPTTSSTTAAEVLTERGLRASGLEHAEMRRNLQGWLELVSLFKRDYVPPPDLTKARTQKQTAASPSLSLRRILLPLSLYPPPSHFTPSLKKMELKEDREDEKGVVEKAKAVVSDVVSARREEIRKDKEEKADQLGKP